MKAEAISSCQKCALRGEKKDWKQNQQANGIGDGGTKEREQEGNSHL